MQKIRALIIEDRPADAELLERQLRRGGFTVISRRVDTFDALHRALHEFGPEIIFADFTMPAMDGLSALQIALEQAPHTPFIFVSGTIGEETAVDALKKGATDYVLKQRPARLVPAVKRALGESRERAKYQKTQAALRSSEGLFRSFMNHIPGRAATRDLQGRFTFVNENWQKAFGVSAVSALGRTISEIFPAEAAREIQAIHQQVVETNKPNQRVVPPGSGSNQRWWLSCNFPIWDANGQIRMVGTIGIDITEQKKQEQKLFRLGRIHAMLAGINSLIVRVTDRDVLFRESCRVAVNSGGFDVVWIGLWDAKHGVISPVGFAGDEAMKLMQSDVSTGSGLSEKTGVARQAIQNKKPVFVNDLASAPDIGSARRKAAIAIGCQSVIGLPLIVDDVAVGALTLYSRQQSFFADDELRLLTELSKDISFALKHIAVHDRAEFLALYDSLTGLPNRTLFIRHMSRALEDAKNTVNQLILVLVDIKRFNLINDTLGRHAGDGLLQEVAIRLRQVAQGSMSLARVSGNCFAILLSETCDITEVAHRVEKAMMRIFHAPFRVADQELTLTAAAGISIFPSDGVDPETLYRNAEAALAKAKAAGEPYLFYELSLNERVAETLQLENMLRQALELDQFVLHYQPKINIRNGAITGFEALIRWRHPEWGLVPPGKFIPLLEETGLIAEVGRWALGRAVADYRNWASASDVLPPRIAVNVSPHQLRQKDFIDTVVQAIEGFGTLGPALDLEITESIVMENLQKATKTLQIIRGLGVNIAIDDFGTGYSSLGYIAKLPISHLKIDRSFIIEMTHSDYCRNIVTMIVSLAKTLDFKVIAEGVDEEEQLQLLQDLGCDEVQGFLFSTPLPPEEILGFLKMPHTVKKYCSGQ